MAIFNSYVSHNQRVKYPKLLQGGTPKLANLVETIMITMAI